MIFLKKWYRIKSSINYQTLGGLDPPGVLPYIFLIFSFLLPVWSENGYKLCLFWSEFGYGFWGNTRVNKRICLFNSKQIRKKASNMRIRNEFWEIFCWRQVWKRLWKLTIFWSEIGSGFGEPGDTTLPRSTPLNWTTCTAVKCTTESSNKLHN